MKVKSMIAGLVTAGLFTIAPMASATLVDFEGYANGTNLNGVNLGGVTLTSTGSVVQVLSNNASGASFKSPVNSVSTFGDFILRGLFDSPTSFVSLWAGDDGGDTDSWALEVFDGANNSLGTAVQGNWNGAPYTQLTISAAGIARFEARWTGTEAGIAWDDLEFASVPEPGTLALLGLGLAGLAASRRRKQ